MADAMFMFGLSAGIFALLVAILFSLRTRRRHLSEHSNKPESHSHSSNGSAGDGRRIKKFKSDGTPVYE